MEFIMALTRLISLWKARKPPYVISVVCADCERRGRKEKRRKGDRVSK